MAKDLRPSVTTLESKYWIFFIRCRFGYHAKLDLSQPRDLHRASIWLVDQAPKSALQHHAIGRDKRRSENGSNFQLWNVLKCSTNQASIFRRWYEEPRKAILDSQSESWLKRSILFYWTISRSKLLNFQPEPWTSKGKSKAQLFIDADHRAQDK